jgi:hypothetical protein
VNVKNDCILLQSLTDTQIFVMLLEARVRHGFPRFNFTGRETHLYVTGGAGLFPLGIFRP